MNERSAFGWLPLATRCQAETALARASLVAAVTALGLLFRLVLLLAFADAPGDGPTRAANGWHWYLTHHVSFAGVWPPGHEILVGLALYLVPDPAWAARLLSLAAGTVGIPLLAALAGRLFGPVATAIAALCLALNPMHAALSATSLSDTVGIAALLGLVLAAFHLADTPRRDSPSLVLTIAALIGPSIRFEFWLALPLVTLHHLARTRSLARTALVALAMAPFPTLWLAERASQGGAAAAYADAISGAAYVGAHSVDLATGAANAAATLVALTGGPLVWLGLLGIVALPLRLHRPGPWADRALPLALLALETLFLAKFAADRGAALWPRYLATELVLLLPFAAGALAVCVRPAAVRAAATALALAAAGYATWARAPDLYLVRAIPEATREAAGWIAARPADEAFLMTRMSWQASYVPVLDRLPPQRYRVLSDWLPDAGRRDFVRPRPPAYVLPRADAAGLLVRLCREGGLMAPARRALATFSRLVVLPLEQGPCG